MTEVVLAVLGRQEGSHGRLVPRGIKLHALCTRFFFETCTVFEEIWEKAILLRVLYCTQKQASFICVSQYQHSQKNVELFWKYTVHQSRDTHTVDIKIKLSMALFQIKNNLISAKKWTSYRNWRQKKVVEITWWPIVTVRMSNHVT